MIALSHKTLCDIVYRACDIKGEGCLRRDDVPTTTDLVVLSIAAVALNVATLAKSSKTPVSAHIKPYKLQLQ